jgi:hypothetical protein
MRLRRLIPSAPGPLAPDGTEDIASWLPGEPMSATDGVDSWQGTSLKVQRSAAAGTVPELLSRAVTAQIQRLS